MHETAIASSILRIALESASAYETAGEQLAITEIILDVDVLSCLEPQTLQGCFEIMADDTAAQGATLTIHIRPLTGTCAQCGQVSTNRRRFDCPTCGGSSVEWQLGHGMEIRSINVASRTKTQE